MPVAIDPAALTLDQVKKWIPEAIKTPEPMGAIDLEEDDRKARSARHEPDYTVNMRLFDGDHWLNGRGWVGPVPSKRDDDELRREAKRRIKTAFCSQNAVKEVTERHMTGVVGRPARLAMVPRETPESRREERDDEDDGEDVTDERTPDERAADEDTAHVREWWNGRRYQTVIEDLCKTVLLGGAAGLRVWVPQGRLDAVDDAGNVLADGYDAEQLAGFAPPDVDFEEALDIMHLEVCPPGSCGEHYDPHTGRTYSVYLYEDADGSEEAEVSYVDRDGLTYIVTVGTDGVEEGTGIDLGGRTTLCYVTREMLVTLQVRQQQYLLNKALTMLSVNMDWSMFLERIFLNAQEPTEEVPDPDNPGKTKLVPAPYKPGTYTATFMAGVVTEDDKGKETVASPSVFVKEPSSGEVFEGARMTAYRSLLHESRQLHALIAGDASPTGEARIQAAADFVVSLLLTKGLMDHAGTHAVEVSHRMARHFAGGAATEADDGEGTSNLRASFATTLDPGPMSAEQMRLVIERVRAMLLSRETGLGLLGIEDIEDELRRIEEETKVQRTTEMAKLAGVLVNEVGLDHAAALRVAGWSEEAVKELIEVTRGSPINQ